MVAIVAETEIQAELSHLWSKQQFAFVEHRLVYINFRTLPLEMENVNHMHAWELLAFPLIFTIEKQNGQDSRDVDDCHTNREAILTILTPRTNT